MRIINFRFVLLRVTVGVASAMLVSVRLLLRAVSRHGRGDARGPRASLPPFSDRGGESRRSRFCQVKPRSHFGRHGVPEQGRMIPKSGNRFSDKIMREQIASMAQASRHGL